jgi:hypothetical protein
MNFAELVPILRAEQGNGFWYLASPYTQYPGGVEKAFQEVAKVHMRLLEEGVHTFCPICHTHPPSLYSRKVTPENSHQFWVHQVDAPFMRAAIGLVIIAMPNWHKSRGIAAEIDYFTKAFKPQHILKWPVE